MVDYAVEVTSIASVYVVNAESAEKAIQYANNEVSTYGAIEVKAREVPEADADMERRHADYINEE